MKKLIILLACVLASGGQLYAQGAFAPPGTATKSINGRLAPAAGATITVCAAGSLGEPCSPVLSNTIYSDLALTQPLPNPFTADASGNYQFAAGLGTYTVTVTGTNIPGYSYQVTLSGGGLSGTIAATQVGFGCATSICGSNNLVYAPSSGGLISTSSNVGPTNVPGSGLVLVNSGGGTASYFSKDAFGSLAIQNDNLNVPNHGYFSFNTQGGTANGDIDLRSGSGGSSLYCNTVANVGNSMPAGSCQLTMFVAGVGTAKFRLHSGSPQNWDQWWDANTGCSTWFANNQTTSGATLCGPQTASQTTVATGNTCGTIAAGGACSNSAPTNFHCISGQATLSAGTSTITGIAPAFTSSSSYTVVTNDNTTIANPNKGVPASGSSITFTGTGTDVLNFVACGG